MKAKARGTTLAELVVPQEAPPPARKGLQILLVQVLATAPLQL